MDMDLDDVIEERKIADMYEFDVDKCECFPTILIVDDCFTNISAITLMTTEIMKDL